MGLSKLKVFFYGSKRRGRAREGRGGIGEEESCEGMERRGEEMEKREDSEAVEAG